MSVAWIVTYGTEQIKVGYSHLERAIDAACSALTKETAYNPKVHDNPAQTKEYNLHISVLRLIESVFAEGFSKFEDHKAKQIPRKR